MHRFRNLVPALLTVVMLAFCAPASRADTFLFTLSTPYQNAAAGDVLTFTATATNTDPTNTVYLNADSTTVDTPLTLNDSDFFANFPLSLGPNESFTGDLFAVTVPSGTTPGLYTGSFSILGGTDPGDFTDTLGTADFNVNVTPEPSTLLLLSTGIAACGTTLRRRNGSRTIA